MSAVEDVELKEHAPIPVRLVQTEKAPPPLAGLSSVVLQGTEAPYQLLPYSRRRSKAQVLYAVALGSSGTAFAYLSKRNASAAIGNHIITSGLVLQTNSLSIATFVWESASELWIAPQPLSVPMLISVVDEWDQDPLPDNAAGAN